MVPAISIIFILQINNYVYFKFEYFATHIQRSKDKQIKNSLDKIVIGMELFYLGFITIRQF